MKQFDSLIELAEYFLAMHTNEIIDFDELCKAMNKLDIIFGSMEQSSLKHDERLAVSHLENALLPFTDKGQATWDENRSIIIFKQQFKYYAQARGF